MLPKQLQDAGLTETEAKIYLASLELGQASVSRISRKAGIKRTTAYLSLENLMQKGLISAIKKSGGSHYYAEDPRNLERIMSEKKERISNLMPELMAFSNMMDKKPEIRYLEGEEGIREVFTHAIDHAKQEICVMYSETFITDFDAEFFSNYLVPRRLKRKISARTLVPDNEQMRALESEKILRYIKLLPPDLFKIRIDLILYGDNGIAIVSFKEKFALIIESVEIKDSFQSIFELLWQSAKDK